MSSGNNKVVVVDLDADGDNDLFVRTKLIANNYQVGGGFSASSFTAYDKPYNIDHDLGFSIADYNSDGYPEVIAGSSWDKMYVYTNSGANSVTSSSFSGRWYPRQDLYCGACGTGIGVDVNGDNKVDVVSSYRDQTSFTVTENLMTPPPVIRESVNTLTQFSKCGSLAGTNQTFTVEGEYLVANIALTCSNSNYQFSLDGTTYSDSLTITRTGTTVSSTTVYVRIKSSATTGAQNGTITLASTDAVSKTISLTGEAYALPTITGSNTVYVGGNPLTLTGNGTPDVTTPWSSSHTNIATVDSSGVVTALAGGSFNILYRNDKGCVNSKAMTSIATAVFSSASSITFNSCTNSVSSVETFNASATSLNGNMTITAPTGFQISLASGSGYTTTISISPNGSGNIASTPIYVRANASATSTSGNIAITSPGVTTVNVSLTNTIFAFPTVVTTPPATQCTIGGTVDLTAAAVTAGSTAGLTFTYFTNSSATTVLNNPSAVTTSGTYYIVGTNPQGCATTASVKANILAGPITSVVLAVGAQPCGSAASGVATVTINGGAGPFTYTWTKGGNSFNAQPSDAPTNLTGGSGAANAYVVTVTDSCGNTLASNSVNFTNTASLTLTNVSQSGTITCNGATTGSITGTITGGGTSARVLRVTNTTSNITYSSQSPVSGTTATGFVYTVSNLPAGVYTVVGASTVSSCTASAANITITEPSALSVSATGTAALCSGVTTGSINATASNGTSPYTYSWTATNGGSVTGQATNEDLSNVLPGTYTIVVSDACTATTGQTATQEFTIEANNVTAGTIAANQTICSGGNPAAFTVTTPSTGSGTLTYQWQSSTDNTTFTNISGATSDVYDAPTGLTTTTYYRRVVTSTLNSVACTATSNVITVTVNAISATISSNQTICSGGNPAAFTASTTSTSGATLSYVWEASTDSGATWTAIANETAATYDVPSGLTITTQYRRVTTSVLNTVSCTHTSNVITVTVNNVTAGTVAADQTVCSGGNPAAFTVGTAATGTGTLTYQWQSSTDNTTFADIANATSDVYDAPNGLTTTTYYRRIVTSTLNTIACTATSNVITVTVNNVTAGTVAADQTVCSGGDPAAFTVGTAASGSGALTYQWQSSIDNSTWSNINTNGTTATYDAPNGITATTYYRRIVTSTLNNVACTATSNVITVTVNSFTAGSIGTSQTLLCNGGNPAAFTEITAATGSGTLTYQWQSSTDNTTFTDISGATSATYDAPNGLTDTTYYRRVVTSSLNGLVCSAISNVVTVTVPALLTIADEGVSDASCANTTDGAIAIGVSGGTGAYTYAWTGPNGFTSTDEDQNYTLLPGTYGVTVTDANGCTASLTGLVVSSPSAVTISLLFKIIFTIFISLL